MDDLRNTLPRVSLLSEAALDIVEHLGMSSVILVQDVLELEICRAKTVAKVLRKNPPAIYEYINATSFFDKTRYQQAYVAS